MNSMPISLRHLGQAPSAYSRLSPVFDIYSHSQSTTPFSIQSSHHPFRIAHQHSNSLHTHTYIHTLYKLATLRGGRYLPSGTLWKTDMVPCCLHELSLNTCIPKYV